MYNMVPDLARAEAEISLAVLSATHCLSLRLSGGHPPGNRELPRGSYSTSRVTFSQGKVVVMEDTGTTKQS